MTPKASSRARWLASIAVLSLALAACGSSSNKAASPTSTSAAAVHAAGEHDMAAMADVNHKATKDDKGFSALKNGHHAQMVLTKLSATDQATLDKQLAVTREVAKVYPTVASAMAAGYHRAGPFQPGLGAHFTTAGPHALNPDGILDDADLRSPLGLLYSGTSPTDHLVGFMYYSMSPTIPQGFAGSNDFWHSHTSICLRRGPDGGEDAPFGMDSDVTAEQCRAAGGFLILKTQYMVHVWTVPGYETTTKDGGPFAEANPKLTCSDGTYYSVPISEWPSHPYNICRSA